jgi:hypothetical protein
MCGMNVAGPLMGCRYYGTEYWVAMKGGEYLVQLSICRNSKECGLLSYL